ncbi:MAG TPA: MFS transporter [Steroidobacteraceae bacterium]|nr:MFS transporter [Steroidobacteraceae bacterium]
MQQRYVMMTWLLVALLLCYIDRVLMSLAAIEMQKEFGWSDSDKGLVLSSFFVGYLIMQILGGIVANRCGGRNTFLLAVVLWSLFTGLTPAAAYWSFGAVVFARFMLGFGEGAAYPAAYNLIHGWMPVTERSRSIGLMTAAGAAGTVFALLTVGSIIEARGWPSVFYLFGSLGIVWAVAWALVIPATPPALTSKANRSIPWRPLLTHPAVLTLYLLCTAGGSISFVLVSWLPSYFVDEFGLSTAQAGVYSVAPFAVMAVVPILAGRYADKLIAAQMSVLDIRKRLVIAGMLVVAISLALLPLAPAAIASVILASVLFVGIGIAVVGYSPIPAELLPGHGDILFGFMAAAGSLASAAAVALTGVLLEQTGSYAAMFIVLAVLSLAGVLAFQVFGQATPIDARPRERLQLAE